MKQIPIIPALLAIIFVSILGNIYLYFSKNQPIAPIIPDTSVFITPTPYKHLPIPTSTTTTYTNYRQWYQINYPSSWQVKEDVLLVKNGVPRDNTSIHDGNSRFIKIIALNEEKWTVSKVIKNKKADFKVAGLDTYFINHDEYFGWSSIDYFFIKSNKIYQIKITSNPDDDFSVFSPILSSFQFIEPIQPTKFVSHQIQGARQYSLLIPHGWAVTEDYGPDYRLVSINKDGYEISISTKPVGGGYCSFPDSPPMQTGYTLSFAVTDGFRQISTNWADLRYFISKDETSRVFCGKNRNDRYYTVPTSIGHIVYQLPNGDNSVIIEEMNAIIASSEIQ